MPKIPPKLHPDQVLQARGINENLFFHRYQKALVWLANTDYGKDLLCIDKGIPGRVVAFAKNAITFSQGGGRHISDFRCGGKWGNVIRTRWQEVSVALAEHEKHARGWVFPHEAFRSAWKQLASGVMVPAYAGAVNTSSTFYPDPNAETNSVDGYESYFNANQPWSTIHDATNSSADDRSDSSTAIVGSYLSRYTSVNPNWRAIYRSFFFFYTGPTITTGSTINSATFSIKGGSVLVQTGYTNIALNVTYTSSTSTTALATADYGNVTKTTDTGYSTAIASGSWSTSAYNDFALNASGLAIIGVGGTALTRLCCRDYNWDMANTAPSPYPSGNDAGFSSVTAAETAGTTSDPKLVVDWGTSSGASAPILCNLSLMGVS